MNLVGRFGQVLSGMDLPPGPVLLAVSGGVDSLVLLDLMAHAPAAAGLELHVGHVDHGIHPDSAAVARAVEVVAGRYRIPCRQDVLHLGPDASESIARVARYASLRRMADEIGAASIVTAHHRDDQIETVLMRFLGGSGPAGLAGMAPRAGRIVRPLLSFWRVELVRHAESLGVTPWEDPANRDMRHTRAWVRHELLPMLRHRIADFEGRLLEVAEQAARDRAAWDTVLHMLPGLDLRSECDGVSVAASPLGGYDSAVVRALLGALGRRFGFVVGPMRAARVEQLLAGGRSGAVAQLGQGCAAELSFGRLRLFREATSGEGGRGPDWVPTEIGGGGERAGNGKGEGNLQAGIWHLSWREDRAPERLERASATSWFAPGAYLVRRWAAGDRLRPLGGTGRRLVVRCMQDARIARHERAAWPVLERGGTIVWVPEVCRSADHLPAPGAAALRIDAYRA